MDPSRHFESRQFESRHTLRDETEERERLEAANFDLKLRIHHLEDALKRFTNTDSMGVEIEEVTSENTNLKMQVHQQKLELQERNIVLGKAKTAIEVLKPETERLRAIEKDAQMLTNKSDKTVQELKESKDRLISKLQSEKEDITRDSSERIAAKDLEIQRQARQIESSEKLLNGLQKALEDATSNITKANNERDIAKDSVARLEKAAEYEEEVTQLRAQVELMSMQIREQEITLTEYRSTAERSLSEKDSHILELRAKLAEEEETSRKVIDDQRSVHLKTIEDLRTAYHKEIEETQKSSSKRTELIYRDDVDMLKRQLSERSEEVKSSRKLLEGDRDRAEELVREAEMLRNDIRAKDIELANARRDASDNIEIKKKHDELFLELENTRGKFQESCDKLLVSREELRKTESQLLTLQAEMRIITQDQGNLKSAAGSVEITTRDNERLKYNVSSLEGQLREEKLKLEKCEGDLKHSQQDTNETQIKLNAANQRLVETDKLIAAFEEEKSLLEESVKQERARAVKAESVLLETRSQAGEQKLAIETFRESDRAAARIEAERIAILTNVRQTYGQILSDLSRWNADLDIILDGTDIVSGVAGYNSISIGASVPDQEADIPVLMQRLTAKVEVVKVKMGRFVRIRNLLMTQCYKMAESTEKKMDESVRSCKFTELRIDKADRHLDLTSQLVERDHRLRLNEHENNRAFKDEIANQHSARVEETTTQIRNLTHTLEHERKVIHDLRTERATEVAHYEARLEAADAEKQTLLEDIRQLEENEKMINSLESRLEQLAQNNEELQHNVQETEARLVESQEYINRIEAAKEQIENEKQDLEKEHAALEQQCTNMQNTLEGHENTLLLSEQRIRQLESRQMDPELAERIRATQSVVEDIYEPLNKRSSTSSASTGEMSDLTLRLNDIVSNARVLVTDSEESRSALNGNEEAISDASVIDALKELLESNVILTRDLNQVAQEWKQALRRVSGSASVNVSSSVRSTNTTAMNTNTNARIGYTPSTSVAANLRSPEPSSRSMSGTNTTTNPASPLVIPSFATSRVVPGSRNVPTSVIKHRGLQQSQYRQRARNQSQPAASYTPTTTSTRRPSTAIHTPHVSSHNTQERQNTPAAAFTVSSRSEASRTPPQSSILSRKAPTATPLTAARASVSRLTKLSSDLHELSSKLEKFENRTLNVHSALTDDT